MHREGCQRDPSDKPETRRYYGQDAGKEASPK